MLTADAAGLHAAEGKFIVAIVKRVHPDVASLELVDGLVGVNQIARPYRGAKAELRRVGFLDGLIALLLDFCPEVDF